jgi:tRNA 2-selenouridine synthase
MALKRISAAEAVAGLDTFHTVIDARSESEHAEDHLPGAVNWPVLNDAERAAIGTEYKQVSPFDARKRGAALAAQNIARHVQQQVMDKPRGWRPLVYCWRGGQRSGALALVLDQIGFYVQVLDGGYRAFRRIVLVELETLPEALHLRVLCGRTGSAKTRLLRALAEAGEQVLDLERLACHRGSVLGPEPGQEQPSQKAFETTLWQALRGFDAARPVYVESESRTIGRLRVPEALLQRMRAAPCWQVVMPLEARVDFLMDDYAHLASDTEAFCARLEPLGALQGKDTVAAWQAEVRAGRIAGVVQALLERHYDPVYTKSMSRNFTGFALAPQVALRDASAASLQQAVADITGPQALP